MEEQTVRAFFARYARLYAQALAGEADLDALAALYAPEFIAASPLGVRAGRNDAGFRAALAQGYARDRRIGTQEMRLGAIRLSALDPLHCVVRVGWTAAYARPDLPRVEIAFEVHYLLQMRDGAPTVFGWVSGDEQALLRRHGIL